jgi:hypothetical protein
VKEGGTGTHIADDEYRFRDFLPPKTRKKKVVEEKADPGRGHPEYEKDDKNDDELDAFCRKPVVGIAGAKER